MSCESGAQLQLRAAPLKPLHRYSAPCPKAGLRAWEEPTLPHDRSLLLRYSTGSEAVSEDFVLRPLFRWGRISERQVNLRLNI